MNPPAGTSTSGAARTVPRRRWRRLQHRCALAQLVGRQHGLVVLLLVLHDHAERERVLGEPPALEPRTVQDVEHLVAHLAHVTACLGGVQQRQPRPVRPRVLERVVELVDVGAHRLAAADVADQPELLLVADVREVPHQRRHQHRVLADEVLVVDGVGEQDAAPPGPFEAAGDQRAQFAGGESFRGGHGASLLVVPSRWSTFALMAPASVAGQARATAARARRGRAQRPPPGRRRGRRGRVRPPVPLVRHRQADGQRRLVTSSSLNNAASTASGTAPATARLRVQVTDLQVPVRAHRRELRGQVVVQVVHCRRGRGTSPRPPSQSANVSPAGASQRSPGPRMQSTRVLHGTPDPGLHGVGVAGQRQRAFAIGAEHRAHPGAGPAVGRRGGERGDQRRSERRGRGPPQRDRRAFAGVHADLQARGGAHHRDAVVAERRERALHGGVTGCAEDPAWRPVGVEARVPEHETGVGEQIGQVFRSACTVSTRAARSWCGCADISTWPPGSTVTGEPAGRGRGLPSGRSEGGLCGPSAAAR